MSAASAAIAGLRMGLAIILMVPITLVVNYFLEGKSPRHYDYKFALVFAAIFGGGLFVLQFVAGFTEYLANARLGNQVYQIFSGKIWIEMLCIACLTFAALSTWGLLKEKDPLADLLIPAGMAALAIYLWPRTIHLTDHAVWQRKLYGAKHVIPYSHVESIVFDQKQSAIIVNSDDGSRIVHCVHRNPELFQQELEKRTGKRIFT